MTQNARMREPQRIRALGAVAVAGLVVAAVAVAYLHPLPPGTPDQHREPNPSQVGIVRLADFEVVSAKEAWALIQSGGTAFLYATADGGRTWRQLPIPRLYDDRF